MLFFGYIVSEVKYNDLEEDVVKVVSSPSECTRELPKLIVGLDRAKEYATAKGFEFDILEHTFPNGDVWTFKKTEKRELYEEDVDTFKKRVVRMQGHDVKYCYVNIYALGYTKLKKLYNILFCNLLHKNANYIIVDRNMFYMCIDRENVIGISFQDLRYVGISSEKVIAKLRSQKANKVYFTTSKNMWKLKDWFYDREYVIASIFETNAQKRN